MENLTNKLLAAASAKHGINYGVRRNGKVWEVYHTVSLKGVAFRQTASAAMDMAKQLSDETKPCAP